MFSINFRFRGMKTKRKVQQACQSNGCLTVKIISKRLWRVLHKMFARQSKLHDLSKLNLTLISSHFRHKRLKHKQAQLRLYYTAQWEVCFQRQYNSSLSKYLIKCTVWCLPKALCWQERSSASSTETIHLAGSIIIRVFC